MVHGPAPYVSRTTGQAARGMVNVDSRQAGKKKPRAVAGLCSRCYAAMLCGEQFARRVGYLVIYDGRAVLNVAVIRIRARWLQCVRAGIEKPP